MQVSFFSFLVSLGQCDGVASIKELKRRSLLTSVGEADGDENRLGQEDVWITQN